MGLWPLEQSFEQSQSRHNTPAPSDDATNSPGTGVTKTNQDNKFFNGHGDPVPTNQVSASATNAEHPSFPPKHDNTDNTPDDDGTDNSSRLRDIPTNNTPTNSASDHTMHTTDSSDTSFA